MDAVPGEQRSDPDQPLGEPVDFRGAAAPQPAVHRGQRVLLRPIEPAHDTGPLYAASHAPRGDPTVWTYLYDGPYRSLQEFHQALATMAASGDPLFFVITRAADGKPLGMIAYLAIVPEHGTIELGHIWFGPELKRTQGATEAIFLLASHALDELGYRRLEWKCNALNASSRRAALRFGFDFEGVFHNHRVVKGRNRDTAWFAITDLRWPVLRTAFTEWLSPENFDNQGGQRSRLSDLTAAAGRMHQ